MKTQAVTIQIATGDARPIFKQIVDGICIQIAKRELATGSKLPSVRALAQQLRINPNTVAKAYGELTSQGFLESRKGLGIFVKQRSQMLSRSEQDRRLQTAINGFINAVISLDVPPEEMVDQLRESLLAVMKNDGQKN